MDNSNIEQKLLHVITQLQFTNQRLTSDSVIAILERFKALCKDEKQIELVLASLKHMYNKDICKSKKLTQREIDVVLHIAKGYDSKTVASILNISKSTIETHRKKIRKKLELKGNDNLFAFSLIYSLQYQEQKKSV